MATIQIREVPEEAYEVIRRRARAEGKSIQAYMLERIVELADRPSTDEAVRAIEAALEEHGPAGATIRQIVDDVAAERR